MFNVGPWELLLIFLIVLLIFGGKKIPEIARGLGKGINEFKKAKDGIEDEIKKEITKDEKSASEKKDDKGSDKIA